MRRQADHRSRIDDAAEFVWQHELRRIPRQAKAGGEIDGDHAIEIGILPFGERLAMLDAGIVDEDVELAMLLDQPRQAVPALRHIGHIEGRMIGLELFRRIGQRFLIARIEDHGGAMFCQGLGHSKAQPARGAGDEGGAPFK